MITLYPQNQIRNFLKAVRSTDRYKNFLEDFKRKGSETVKYEPEGNTIHIYSPELAYVLTLNENIRTDNYDNGSKETLNTNEFLGHFFDGFCEGLKDFQEDFKLNPDTKYGGDISDYLEDIKHHCFEANIMGHKQGWGFVRLHFPLTFQKELIFKYGYYSGLVRSVDELIVKNPSRFRELDSDKRHFLNRFQNFDRNILATAVRSVRPIKSPEFLKDERVVYDEVIEIENLMFDDSKKLTFIEDFKTKTQHVFEQTKPKIHNQLFEYLINRATNHLNTKKEEKTSGTGKYIDKNSKQIGNTSIQSEWKKTPKENIGIKVNTLESYLNWLNENYKELKTLPPQQENKKSKTESIWFKVAVLFASGKMAKYYSINGSKEFVMNPDYTAPKIAKELNASKYDKFILATINAYSNDNTNAKKNIFNRTVTELREVIKYCEDKKIEVIPDFIERFNLIKDK